MIKTLLIKLLILSSKERYVENVIIKINTLNTLESS